jgi:TetR/AcrR family transcriptional repressor of mexJK operon
MNLRDSDISERKRTNIMAEHDKQVTKKTLKAETAADAADLAGQAGRPVDVLKDSAIMDAARELLFQKGPQAVTMEAVAKKAGVSKVTVYARHKNRDALLGAVIQSQVAGFTGMITGVQGSIAEVREVLLNFSVNVMAFQISDEHVQLMRAISAASNIPDQVLQDVYSLGPHSMIGWLAQWLADLHKAGLVCCENPAMSAELLGGMLQRLEIIRTLYRVKVDYSAEELQKQAEFIVDAFLKIHRAG